MLDSKFAVYIENKYFKIAGKFPDLFETGDIVYHPDFNSEYVFLDYDDPAHTRCFCYPVDMDHKIIRLSDAQIKTFRSNDLVVVKKKPLPQNY